MYMRTSPMHPPLHPCRGANSEAGSGSGSAERPIIPLTRPSPIPMLPCTTTTVTVATASQEAIQLATVENSPKSLASDQNSLDLYNICSPKALCGPHPKKVTIVVALILSIWASFVLGINIHKRVCTIILDFRYILAVCRPCHKNPIGKTKAETRLLIHYH